MFQSFNFLLNISNINVTFSKAEVLKAIDYKDTYLTASTNPVSLSKAVNTLPKEPYPISSTI
jgi:hypothetical protein